MATKPGPLLLLAGAAALAMMAKKKKPTNGLGDLPEPPGPEPGPIPDEEIELAPPGAILEPGEHGIHVGVEYTIPYRTGDPEDLQVSLEIEGADDTPAVYGPNEDYVWEKETAKDFIIIQFQRVGNYYFTLETGGYNLKVR